MYVQQQHQCTIGRVQAGLFAAFAAVMEAFVSKTANVGGPIRLHIHKTSAFQIWRSSSIAAAELVDTEVVTYSHLPHHPDYSSNTRGWSSGVLNAILNVFRSLVVEKLTVPSGPRRGNPPLHPLLLCITSHR